MKRLLLLIGVVLALSRPSLATTFYTSKTGDNTTGLSLAHGKTTIAAGLALLSSGAGDTLLINDGTYAESITNIVSGASAGSPTIVRAINNRAVTLTGVSAFNAIITIQNRDFIVIDGLVLLGDDTMYWALGAGDDFSGFGGEGSSYITLQNSTALGPEYCVGLGRGGTIGKTGNHHYFILNNIIGNCGNTNPSADGFPPHGIYMGGEDSLVEGNEVFNTGNSVQGGAAIHQYNGAGGLDNNIYRNNIVHDSYGAAFVIRDGVNSEVYNNVMYNNGLTASGVGGIAVTTDDCLIAFNTIYANSDRGVWIIGGSNNRIKNNILYLNGNDTILDDGTSTDSSNNLTTDPDFVNVSGHDFHLLDTSDALAAGVAVTEVTVDFDGVTRPDPPSIGAYETPSGSNPTDPLDEDFDSYSAGTSIDGLNLGSGFTQSWQLLNGTVTVENSPAWMSGKSSRFNAASGLDEARRLFTAQTGVFSRFFRMSQSITNGYFYASLLDEAGNGGVFITMNSAGAITIQGTTLLAGYTINHSYLVEVNFDLVGHPNQARVALDGGSYSSWVDSYTGYSSITGIKFTDTGTDAHTAWIDDIGDVANDVDTALPRISFYLRQRRNR